MKVPHPDSPSPTLFERRAPALFALIVSCFLLLSPIAVLAQTAEEPEPSAVVPAAESEPVPHEHASARATMRTFLEAFDPTLHPAGTDGLAIASACLDLSEIRSTVRERLGREYARQLKEILDRSELIDLDALSDDPEAEPWRLSVGDGAGEVVLAPDQRGEWLFTRETVEAVPTLYRAVESQEIVEGVIEATPLTPALWLRSQVPAPLRRVGFLLEYWQWAGLFVLVLLALILDRLVTTILRGTVERYLARRTESIERGDLDRALRPTGWLVGALVVWFGVLLLGLPPMLLDALITVVEFLAAAAFVWAIYRAVDVITAVLAVRATRSENKFDDLLVPLVRTSLKVFIVAFGFVFLAEVVNLPLGGVIAGLGVGGLAIALAAQDAVKNFFGSLMILLDRPFAVGDWVKIGEVEGTIAELGFRSTRVRTFYDSIVTVPNANMISATVDNFGRRRYRRWSTHLAITYATPPDAIEAFCEGIRELVRRHPFTRKDAFEVHLNRLGTSSLDVLLYIFFDAPDWSTELRERHRLALDILRLGHQLGVEFAFPTQTVHVQHEGETRPHPATEGYDTVVAEALERGRAQARALVDGALGGQAPPPVGDSGAGEANG